ncbi:helix-turn-helix transcriptional regulator [uncultured Oscillibacter sp.]|uniref:helix-turn-helix domain-containing protein n=1 Tax=uncultured Oscillibacter sp. TaxID=876091 RepID=UPI002630F62C|nr:helix-turn-helix transcriptional regulator [uncultured Oscillibacter sp.]
MNNIRLLREQNDMTMEELAERVGVKHPAVFKWEHGRNNPSLKNARKLADIFGVSLDYLMGRDSA